MNRSNSNHHCLLRHDPVTARAISRLSHGVARLTASLNPNRQYRHFRTRHTKLRNRTESESTLKNNQPITTGSKRKWQPDKIELDTIMEMDHSTVCLKPSMQLSSSSSNIESLQHVTLSIDALNLQTKQVSSFSCSNLLLHKSLSSDQIETMGRYSSGSSMLSITASSDNNNNESDASSQDADVEDAYHGDLLHLKGDRSLLRVTRRKPTLLDKHSYELWKPGDTVYNCGGGGDSSDGLSINIKIPRLTSTCIHNTTSSSGICEHSSFKLSPAISSSSHHMNSSIVASSSSDTNHHRRRKNQCKCRLQNKSGITDKHKSEEHICHKGCIKGGSRSSSSSSLTTEDSSDENCSKGFGVYKHRFASISEYQKSCDTDMLKMTSCRSNNKMTKKNIKSSTKVDSHHVIATSDSLNSSKYLLDDSNNSTLDEPVDPELSSLLQETWPLLSTRAKLGYAKAMNLSNSKRYPNSKKRNTPNNLKVKEDSKSLKNNSIKFVPSKLDHLNVQKDSCLHTDKPNRRMPTPPWMISDNESLRDSDEFDSDHNKKVHTTYVNSQRPCVDSWKPQLSNAKPLTEANKGHRLLQKLGWKPGDCLGKISKGLITPVNCKDNHQFSM